MLIGMRNAMMGGGSKHFPYKRRLEYLDSDGNAYIDTGYVFQFGDEISATFQPLATPTQTAYFFGSDTAYNAGLNVHYDPSASSFGLRYCYGNFRTNSSDGIIISPTQAFSISTIYVCNGNSNKRTINTGENTISVQDSGLNSASVILFCARRNVNIRPVSTGWAVASRFFSFQVSRNGVYILDLIPVIDWNDEPCMYDRVSEELFGNAGTGDFVLGPDK